MAAVNHASYRTSLVLKRVRAKYILGKCDLNLKMVSGSLYGSGDTVVLKRCHFLGGPYKGGGGWRSLSTRTLRYNCAMNDDFTQWQGINMLGRIYEYIANAQELVQRIIPSTEYKRHKLQYSIGNPRLHPNWCMENYQTYGANIGTIQAAP